MSWMAPCDELGDRREPVELGNSVGSDVDAALTSRQCTVEWQMTHSTVRLGNGKLDALTELHRVNHSPENRFEARPLRETSTATGTFRVTFAMAKNAGVRLSTGGRIFMSKNDLTSVRAPKVKTSVIATKRTKARLAKLKTSSWYEGAARSVGINKGRPAEKRER